MKAAGKSNFNLSKHKQLWTYSLWTWLQEQGYEFDQGHSAMLEPFEVKGKRWLITTIQDIVEWNAGGHCHYLLDSSTLRSTEATWTKRRIEGMVQLAVGLKLIHCSADQKAVDLILLEGKDSPLTWRCSLWRPCGGKWMARSTSQQRLQKIRTETRTVDELTQLTHSGLGYLEGNDIIIIKVMEIRIGNANAPPTLTDEAIYTDGSFNVEFNGLLVPGKHAYSGGIIRLEHGHFKSGLHIKDDTGLRQRSFGAESMALCYAALHHRGNIVSDCKAAVNILTDRKFKPPTSYRDLYQVARHKLLGKVIWIKAHTLEQNGGDVHLLTIHERGNMYADLVAKGELTTNITTVKTSQILKDAATAANWGIRKGKQLLIGNIMDHKAHNELAAYWAKENRNQHSWNTFLLLMNHKKQSLRERGARIKLFLSRFDRDRKGQLRNLPQCDCGCDNYITTWTSCCTNPRVTTIRQQGLHTAINSISSLPLKQAFQEILESKESRLWRGDWRRADIDFIADRLHFTKPNWKLLTEQLCTAIYELGTTALTIQSTITGNAKLTKCKQCTQHKHKRTKGKGKREKKLANLREQATNHKITEYFVHTKKQRTGIG